MSGKFKALRSQLNAEDGFTLIELMIVVVIIGILAIIAIPVFSNQQKAAIDSSVQNDTRNTNLVIQTWISKHPTSKTFNWAEIASSNTHSYSNTKITVFGTPIDYCIKVYNPDGLTYNSITGPYYIFISALGKYGSVPSLPPATTSSCNNDPSKRGDV